MPGGVRRRTRAWAFLPVGASGRHSGAQRRARLIAPVPLKHNLSDASPSRQVPRYTGEPGDPPVPSYEGVGGRRVPGSGFPPGAVRRRLAGGASHPAVVTPVRFHSRKRGPLGFVSHCKRLRSEAGVSSGWTPRPEADAPSRTGSGARTRTSREGQEILSLPRLPISPSRQARPAADSDRRKTETHTERAVLGASGQAKWRRRRADSNRRIEVLQTSALATWLRRLDPRTAGAGHGIRTRDFNLGKVALYH